MPLEQKKLVSFDGLELAYYEVGRGDPVVLLHGFAADTQRNWIEPGVWEAVAGTGRRVIGLDARGHGASQKPHDPSAYSHGAMVRDVQCLMDELGDDSFDVCGYSMGGITTLRLAMIEPRVRSAVLGGIGPSVLDGGTKRRASEIVDALEVDDPSEIQSQIGRGFRAFADATGADRAALAAIQRSRTFEDALQVGTLGVPGIVVAGSLDELVGDPAKLAEHLGTQLRVVPGNHLSAVFAPAFADAIVSFLAGRDETA